ncbi:hypothetical protein [Ruminococcus sp.]|uniref:hypothetical protein n=1 Tax=Ruminococcus sp. TaxID=41978 RepID=UPI001B6D3AAC|nr:hypothetical protein [Ruminococcus sp.]MBP5433660.1 hypothetical protein [Ruminococcus sp.]
MNDRNNQYAQSMYINMQNGEGEFFNNNSPPKLGEKSITENGTYTAKEDKLDGYSSVTADVAGDAHFSEVDVTVPSATGNVNCKILDSKDGLYAIESTSEFCDFSLVTPAKKLTVLYLTPNIIFTPSSDFDGFYDGDNKVLSTGDEIVPGDGKRYLAKCNRQYGVGPLSVTITKYSANHRAIIK